MSRIPSSPAGTLGARSRMGPRETILFGSVAVKSGALALLIARYVVTMPILASTRRRDPGYDAPMSELTFRDFAGAIMGNDTARAGEVLEELLGLDKAAGADAATHFQRSMAADPTFMAKAMGLRNAVTGGTDEEIAALLGDCFGIVGGAVAPAVTALRKKYPAPQ